MTFAAPKVRTDDEEGKVIQDQPGVSPMCSTEGQGVCIVTKTIDDQEEMTIYNRPGTSVISSAENVRGTESRVPAAGRSQDIQDDMGSDPEFENESSSIRISGDVRKYLRFITLYGRILINEHVNS